jgi:hypothetical protein
MPQFTPTQHNNKKFSLLYKNSSRYCLLSTFMIKETLNVFPVSKGVLRITPDERGLV